MTQARIETLILNHLLTREGFLRKALPFLKSEYFNTTADRILFEVIDNYVEQYNAAPTIEAIDIALQNNTKIGEHEYAEVHDVLSEFQPDSAVHIEWLLDETEKFCKNKAIYNAIVRAIKISDGKDEALKPDAIPGILQDALSVSFDVNIGHDYIESASDRYDLYVQKQEKLAFDLDLMNRITKGGVPRKTLNVCMAPTGVGKSIFLCHMAANYLAQGKNVLYITMEMAEERIAERIDANLLDVSLDELQKLSKKDFVGRVDALRSKTTGKLFIKEYPTGSAHAGHFRALLSEYRIKKNFTPDVVIVDYLNICASSRMKMGGSINTNTFVKSVAEELRGLAVEQNVVMWSATQTNRGGYGNSDLELTDTADAISLPMTVDFMFAIHQDEDMEKQMQCVFKQLKNRYGKMSLLRRFIMGLDKDKMRFFDVEWNAQKSILQEDAAVDTALSRQPISQRGSVEKNFAGILI